MIAEVAPIEGHEPHEHPGANYFGVPEPYARLPDFIVYSDSQLRGAPVNVEYSVAPDRYSRSIVDLEELLRLRRTPLDGKRTAYIPSPTETTAATDFKGKVAARSVSSVNGSETSDPQCCPMVLLVENTSIFKYSGFKEADSKDYGILYIHVPDHVSLAIRKVCHRFGCEFPGYKGAYSSLRVRAAFHNGVPVWDTFLEADEALRKNWKTLLISEGSSKGGGSEEESTDPRLRILSGQSDFFTELKTLVEPNVTCIDAALQISYTCKYEAKTHLIIYLKELTVAPQRRTPLLVSLSRGNGMRREAPKGRHPSDVNPLYTSDPQYPLGLPCTPDLINSAALCEQLGAGVVALDTCGNIAYVSPEDETIDMDDEPHPTGGHPAAHNCLGGGVCCLDAVADTTEAVTHPGEALPIARRSPRILPGGWTTTHKGVHHVNLDARTGQRRCIQSGLVVVGDFVRILSIKNPTGNPMQGDVMAVHNNSKDSEKDAAGLLTIDCRVEVQLCAGDGRPYKGRQMRKVPVQDVRILMTAAERADQHAPDPKLKRGHAILPVEELTCKVPSDGVLCIFWDTEATGLSPDYDDITQIGCVARFFSQGGWVDAKNPSHVPDHRNLKPNQFSRYVLTDKFIPAPVQRLTGINKELLKAKGIPLQKALSEWAEWIGKIRESHVGSPLWMVAHNGNRYDLPLLAIQETKKCKESVTGNFLKKIKADAIVDSLVVSRTLNWEGFRKQQPLASKQRGNLATVKETPASTVEQVVKEEDFSLSKPGSPPQEAAAHVGSPKSPATLTGNAKSSVKTIPQTRRSHGLSSLYTDVMAQAMVGAHDALGDATALSMLMTRDPFLKAWRELAVAWPVSAYFKALVCGDNEKNPAAASKDSSSTLDKTSLEDKVEVSG